MKDVAYIAGRYCNQNELFASYLSERTNLVVYQKQLQYISHIINHKIKSTQLLILFDWLRNDFNSLYSEIQNLYKYKNKNVFYSIFNFEKKDFDIKDFLYCGIHGVFFESDSLELIVKGVNSILQGDLWYSRRVLKDCLLDDIIHFSRSLHIGAECLTLREKEIFKHLLLGEKNNEIANILGISNNTVKTHVYRIYQKLHVHNRSKAALWALKNFAINEDITNDQ